MSSDKRLLSSIPQGRTVDALESVWASVRALVGGLTDRQWHEPTALPGWNVQANVSHMLGTEAMLDGETPPPAPDTASIAHVRNEIGSFNETWVESMARLTPDEMLERFDTLTDKRIRTLRAMSEADWNAESFTPAGPDSYGRFMQIRVFDCWMHEQDIRAAVDLPGHDAGPAVDVSLDEMTTAMGFVVGKKAGAPRARRVTFSLTGPAGRDDPRGRGRSRDGRRRTRRVRHRHAHDAGDRVLADRRRTS